MAEEAIAIEEATRTQFQCRQWYEQRQWHIMASKFGAVCKATARRNMDKFCRTILHPTDLNNPAVLHGRQYESTAISQLQQIKGQEVKSAGLFISPEHPYLGASPDGLLGEHCIIEVKCPYNGRNGIIVPGDDFKFLEYIGDKIRLKRSSDYYFQIQGQMALSQRHSCVFVVYTFKEMLIEEVSFKYEVLEIFDATET